jgi:hypothetical protein
MHGEPELFPLPHDEAHVHLSWTAETGWSVWLSTWAVASGPSSSESEGYERLTLAEALCVVESALESRLPHLRHLVQR